MRRTAAVVAAVHVGVMAALWFGPTPAEASEGDGSGHPQVRRATQEAIERIGEKLGSTGFRQVDRVAVVPLRNDGDGYATSALKSEVTRSPYKLFARDDAEWDRLLGEIEWGAKREDVMDPATVQKFGRVKGVDAILYGRVWDRDVNLWSARARVNMSVHLSEVETGRILWSSGPVQSAAFIHWSDALTRFWRFPLLVLAALVVLGMVWMFIRFLKHKYRPL